MSVSGFRAIPALAVAVILLATSPGLAQQPPAAPPAPAPSATPAAPQQPAAPRPEELTEAPHLPNNAGNAECMWHGRRVVSLLWREDLDAAFRHMAMYERFECPSEHVKAAFRCVVRQGNTIDARNPEGLMARVSACWLAPANGANAATR